MTGPCEHPDFTAFVDVARINDTPDGPIIGYSASVKVDCAVCGEGMRWMGLPVGLSPREPCTSVDGSELRAPLRPASAAPGFGEDGPAFRVRLPRGEPT